MIVFAIDYSGVYFIGTVRQTDAPMIFTSTLVTFLVNKNERWQNTLLAETRIAHTSYTIKMFWKKVKLYFLHLVVKKMTIYRILGSRRIQITWRESGKIIYMKKYLNLRQNKKPPRRNVVTCYFRSYEWTWWMGIWRGDMIFNIFVLTASSDLHTPEFSLTSSLPAWARAWFNACKICVPGEGYANR